MAKIEGETNKTPIAMIGLLLGVSQAARGSYIWFIDDTFRW